MALEASSKGEAGWPGANNGDSRLHIHDARRMEFLG